MPDLEGIQGISSFSTNYHSFRCAGLQSHILAKKIDEVQKKGKYLLCWFARGFGGISSGVLVCLGFFLCLHLFGTSG